MEQKHLRLIERISNAEHRKKMAERARKRAEADISMGLTELKKAGFVDGNYIMSGHLCSVEMFNSYLKVERIKVMS